jgi:hypothetical protein
MNWRFKLMKSTDSWKSHLYLLYEAEGKAIFNCEDKVLKLEA